MKRSVPITLAAVVLLVAPTAFATWADFGDREPSTPFDTSSFMFPDPTVSGAPRVYFNAFTTSYAGYDVNPNVAALGTRNEAVPIESAYAVLGVWRDCNGDGYMGMAAGALREYDALLLSDASICPPASGSPDEWDGVSHNYNGWVSEVIPIGNDQINWQYNARQYYDPQAMIWGDFGRPDDASTVSGGGTCAVLPAPRGTLQSTGGLLNYAECNSPVGPMTAVNLATADGYRVAGTDVPGAGDPAGIRFANTTDARGNAFWDRPTLGSEDSQYSAVNAFDCSAEPVRVGDVVNDTPAAGSEDALPENAKDSVYAVHDVYQYPPSSNPSVNTDGNVAGTANATFEGLEDCDYSNDRGGDIYGTVEGDNNNAPVQGKAAADWNFIYSSGTRGKYEEFEDLNGDGANETIDNPLYPGRAGADGFGGLGFNPGFSPGWTNFVALIKLIPNTVALRTNLAEGTADPGPAGAYWLTFYAYVGSASTDAGFRLPGGTGKYGSAQCGLATSGIQNGWDCDADNWNLNADGTPVETEVPLAIPGSTYNLRDVDCYDGGNDLGVGLGVPYYGERRCPPS